MTLTDTEKEQLAANPIFSNMPKQDIGMALSCLKATKKSYPPKAMLFQEGEPAKRMGFVLSGQIDLVRYDKDGSLFLLESFTEGETFGEAYVLSGQATYGVDAMSRRDSAVLWLDLSPLYQNLSCGFAQTLFRNLVADLAQKDLLLKSKVTILSQKGLEKKVLTLLTAYSSEPGKTFLLPFTRAAMASYLGCDRSALSRLLSTMTRQGKIRYQGNQFCLPPFPWNKQSLSATKKR
jgi:CRP-like cAMP-binding protein